MYIYIYRNIIYIVNFQNVLHNFKNRYPHKPARSAGTHLVLSKAKLDEYS